VGTLTLLSSFGEDALGNLYALDLVDGDVFLLPEPAGLLPLAAGAAAVLWLARLGSRRAC
jgi:hypothetical protein